MKYFDYKTIYGVTYPNCYLMAGKYVEGEGLCLRIMSSGYGPILTATLNPHDEVLEDGEVCIKDYSENVGVYEFLLKLGVIYPFHRTTSQGFTVCPICKINAEVLQDYVGG